MSADKFLDNPGVFGSPLFIFLLLGGVALFLVLRKVATWYWKIDRVIELLEQIEENTRPKV